MEIKTLINKAKRYFTIKKRIRKLKVKSFPSIISNNCCGGVIYHDLGQRFTSPTINLYFNHTDFLSYATHLEEYSKDFDLIEDLSATEKFPVGILKKIGLPDVKIFFMHYPDFTTAKAKWVERTKRIDFDNVLVLFDSLNFELNIEHVKTFNSIACKKVVFKQVDTMDVDKSFVFDKFVPDYKKGETLLTYLKANKFYQWRYLDYFDYAEFINSGKIASRNIK